MHDEDVTYLLPSMKTDITLTDGNKTLLLTRNTILNLYRIASIRQLFIQIIWHQLRR